MAEDLGLPPFLFVAAHRQRRSSIQFPRSIERLRLRASNTVVFCAIDDLIPVGGKPLTGFPEFLDSLADSGIPCAWVTSRNRHQLDAAIRKLGHGQPFIAEGGSCVYIAEDYFHLKPADTVRLGRFIAIPVAKRQPAAAEALEELAEKTGITVVSLSSLSPRELVQNTGLARNEAESIRQRDFDELFFFAGASQQNIDRFRQQAAQVKASVRPRDTLWSLAVNANLATCVRELRKLYDRAFHKAAFAVGVATASDHAELFAACDRAIFLTDAADGAPTRNTKSGPAPKALPLFRGDPWSQALEMIQSRGF
jgi:predicted mannosyl-3-phosphoglycerate phosphatase (HAD superfamily)